MTDSRYVCNGVTRHMRRWALQGRLVANNDLWAALRVEWSTRMHVAPTGATCFSTLVSLATKGQIALPTWAAGTTSSTDSFRAKKRSRRGSWVCLYYCVTCLLYSSVA